MGILEERDPAVSENEEELLVIGYSLLVIRYWLLVIRYWLLGNITESGVHRFFKMAMVAPQPPPLRSAS